MPRASRPRSHPVRGHPVVPGAGVRADHGPVRHQNGRMGRGLRAVRDGHGPATVRRQRRKRPDGQDRPRAGPAEPPAVEPIRPVQVERVRRSVRNVVSGGGRGGGGMRTAIVVLAVQRRVRTAQKYHSIRPDAQVFGRSIVAQALLCRNQGHVLRAKNDRFRKGASEKINDRYARRRKKSECFVG